MTYFIETKRDKHCKRNVILVWSIIKTCCKNIGKPEEYTNDDPMFADFFLTQPDLVSNKNDITLNEATSVPVTPDLPEPTDHDKLLLSFDFPEPYLRETHDSTENLPPGEADNDPPMTLEEM